MIFGDTTETGLGFQVPTQQINREITAQKESHLHRASSVQGKERPLGWMQTTLFFYLEDTEQIFPIT